MNALLDAASTWFFDRLTQHLDGSLHVHLVEGMKGPERHYVEVDDERLGPYFPVTVETGSRCVAVVFPATQAFFVYDELLDQDDPELHADEGRVLAEVTASAFRAFAEERTALLDHEPPAREFILRCEDRILQVMAKAPPQVHLLPDAPDLTVARTQTWAAQ